MECESELVRHEGRCQWMSRHNRVLTLQHGAICGIGHSEDVGWDFVSLLPLVKLNHFLRVNGQLFVGVDHDAEEAGVRLRGGSQWGRWQGRDWDSRK